MISEKKVHRHQAKFTDTDYPSQPQLDCVVSKHETTPWPSSWTSLRAMAGLVCTLHISVSGMRLGLFSSVHSPQNFMPSLLYVSAQDIGRNGYHLLVYTDDSCLEAFHELAILTGVGWGGEVRQ